MQVAIGYVWTGKFGRHVQFTADGVPHTANVQNDGSISLYAFGEDGDDCTPTYLIEDDEMSAALTAALSSAA